MALVRDMIDRETKEKLFKLTKKNLDTRKKNRITRRDILDCMKHDSHRRVGGRIKQVRWGR